MESVLSTYKILKKKAFNEIIDESWIDWAIEMVEAGYESDNLYMLAGMTRPYDETGLQELTRKILLELHLDYSNKQKAIEDYALFIITKTIENPKGYLSALRELRDICLDMGYNKDYMNFYLLYYAKDDLDGEDYQYYWDGATKQNIDQVIKDEFSKWVTNYKNRQ